MVEIVKKNGSLENYDRQKIINAINTYDHPENIALRKSIKEYFIKKYNWDDIAKELYRKMMIFYK